MAAGGPIEFVRAVPEQDDIIVAHYLAIWESYGTPRENLRANPRAIVLDFLQTGREQFELASFIAFDDKTPIGSVSCRLNSKTYPVVLRPEHSKEGYIWSVFTDPACRGKGVARKLLAMAIEHLELCECTAVVLHASDVGRPLYAGLGFEPASEMRLKFESATDLSPKPASVAILD